MENHNCRGCCRASIAIKSLSGADMVSTRWPSFSCARLMDFCDARLNQAQHLSSNLSRVVGCSAVLTIDVLHRRQRTIIKNVVNPIKLPLSAEPDIVGRFTKFGLVAYNQLSRQNHPRLSTMQHGLNTLHNVLLTAPPFKTCSQTIPHKTLSFVIPLLFPFRCQWMLPDRQKSWTSNVSLSKILPMGPKHDMPTTSWHHLSASWFALWANHLTLHLGTVASGVERCRNRFM